MHTKVHAATKLVSLYLLHSQKYSIHHFLFIISPHVNLDPTVFTTQSVVATSQGGVSNSVIISTTVVIVVALLVIVCSVCVKWLRGNKAEMRRVSTTIR